VKQGLIRDRGILSPKMPAPGKLPLKQREGQGVAGSRLKAGEIALEFRDSFEAAYHFDRQLRRLLERAGIIQMQTSNVRGRDNLARGTILMAFF
jgi:hypothetical protein